LFDLLDALFGKLTTSRMESLAVSACYAQYAVVFGGAWLNVDGQMVLGSFKLG
jgi:hypothetical protein